MNNLEYIKFMFVFKMKWSQVTLATLILGLAACDLPDEGVPIVEIQDPKIEKDTCASVYSYAKTVLELGRGEFRINGHLWRSYTPLVSDDAKLIAEFAPGDYTNREDIIKLIKDEEKDNLFFWISLDGQASASKLFLLMDFVEDSGSGCWINPAGVESENSIRIFAQPTSGAAQDESP